MPPSVDSPVQTRIPIPVPDGVKGSGRGGPVGRRRIFVQADTGSVLGIELDRADNVHSIKKKMQTMLNVPTEHTALVFGDTVFKGELSELRNDSPLLLTRELQRSLSTPCIYPASDVQVLTENGQPCEVVGGLNCCRKMKRVLMEINKAVNCGVEPVAVSGGLGGAYFFRNCSGKSVAIVKPTDEEPFAPNNPKGYVGRSLGQPGLKRTVRVGETGVREVAAYLLDHKGFAKVPPTVLVKVSHHAFHINSAAAAHKGPYKACPPVAKIASCQKFVQHDCDASDHGTSRFSVAAVHRIGILDIRIFNTDRHAGNILIRDVKSLDSQKTWSHSNAHVNESLELIPIDHGLCLPEALEDPYFEWLHWPQSSLPFSEEELDYIKGLDEYKDADILRRELPMLREACYRMLILSTTLLKRAAAAGLCLAEIGEMMSRDGIEEVSHLELLCMQAKLQVQQDFLSEKMCCEDEEDIEGSLSELSEQFEVEMDHEYFLKLKSTYESPNLSTSGYPFQSLGVFSYSTSPRFSAKTTHSSCFPLQVLPELSAEQEEDGLRLSSVCNGPGARGGFWAGGSGALQRSNLRGDSEVKSPRGAHAKRSPRLRSDFCPLIEEEEDLVSTGANTNTCRKSDLRSPQAMSYRSVSFHNWKERYSNHGGRKTPASEATGKVNAIGENSAFSLGEMKDEEWTYFMEQFEELLEEALAIRRDGSCSLRQRLGMSCQF